MAISATETGSVDGVCAHVESDARSKSARTTAGTFLETILLIIAQKLRVGLLRVKEIRG
jgi:hypothetical protein